MKGKIFLFLFLALVVGILYYLSFGYFSKGERAGTISKLSERGYVFKTYEGVLNEGGFSGETGTLTPRYWEFSAIDDSVIANLKTALSTGERVTLTYHEKFVSFPWNGDTKYFVVDVHFLNDNNMQNQLTNPGQTQPSSAVPAQQNTNGQQIQNGSNPAQIESTTPNQQQQVPAQQNNAVQEKRVL